MFKQREYKKIIGQSALKLHGSYFEKMFDLSPYLEMMQPIPAPTEVLGKICDILTHCKLISPLSSHSLRIIHFFIRKSFGIKKKILDDARQKILKEESYIP